MGSMVFSAIDKIEFSHSINLISHYKIINTETKISTKHATMLLEVILLSVKKAKILQHNK